MGVDERLILLAQVRQRLGRTERQERTLDGNAEQRAVPVGADVTRADQRITMRRDLSQQQLRMGVAQSECFGGETMSRCPRIDRSRRRSGASFWEFVEGGEVEDSMLASLNHDLARTAMMRTADEYGHRMGVTRRECDELAALSHRRARAARRESHLNGGDALRGMFALDAVDLQGRAVNLARDECVRETELERLQKLPGITANGLVSPGNASEIADGAAAVLIASRERAEELGLPSRYEVASYGLAGVDPVVMGRGPVPAIEQALARAGIGREDVDLWEINEAFAA